MGIVVGINSANDSVKVMPLHEEIKDTILEFQQKQLMKFVKVLFCYPYFCLEHIDIIFFKIRLVIILKLFRGATQVKPVQLSVLMSLWEPLLQ